MYYVYVYAYMHVYLYVNGRKKSRNWIQQYTFCKYLYAKNCMYLILYTKYVKIDIIAEIFCV